MRSHSEDPKWLPWHIAPSPHGNRPTSCRRMQAPFATPDRCRVAEFASALSDTLDLVETEMPRLGPTSNGHGSSGISTRRLGIRRRAEDAESARASACRWARRLQTQLSRRARQARESPPTMPARCLTAATIPPLAASRPGFGLPREVVGRGQTVHGVDETLKGVVVGDPAELGVDLTVAEEIRQPAPRARVRPEIRSDAQVVVLVTARR